MKPFVFDPKSSDPQSVIGAVIPADVRVEGKRRFRKGHRFTAEDLPDLAKVEHPIHVIQIEPDEVHEDEAAIALAEAVSGQGVERRKPVQSRVNMIADRKGLLRVDRDRVIALNRMPGISVFTLLDGLAVVPGKNIAGAKISPVAVKRSVLDEALALAAEPGPVVEVKPFTPKQVSVVTTEGLGEKVWDRFRSAVEQKIGWYGSTVTGFTDLIDDPDYVAGAITDAIDAGADLILTGGGNALDPLDPTIRALHDIGAEFVKFGAPAHPGSMFWLAYKGSTPIFSLASCSLYSRSTVADVVLPWIMADEQVELDDMAGIGYGGLLDRDMSFRFPPYDAASVHEPDEE
jgi:hypothetical protein